MKLKCNKNENKNCTFHTIELDGMLKEQGGPGKTLIGISETSVSGG